LDSCPYNFFKLFFYLLFLNNFYIAPCLFSAIKLLKDSNKNLEHLIGGWKTQTCFCVHPRCRSRTFLSGSRWKACFCPTPSVEAVHMWVVCTWSWF
jgi:hypothetical protein